MATRCFWPPESICGSFRAKPLSPTRSRASSTRRLILCGSSPRFSGPKATSSSTTVATIWLSGFWKTMPAAWCTSQTRFPSRVSMPLTRTTPPVGCKGVEMLGERRLPRPVVAEDRHELPLLDGEIHVCSALLPSSSFFWYTWDTFSQLRAGSCMAVTCAPRCPHLPPYIVSGCARAILTTAA